MGGAHATLLTEIIGVLRAARPAPVVDVDEGWRPDRDFSLAVGRWGWLHVRALVEEHAAGPLPVARPAAAAGQR